jgi:hypothetical protein
VEVLESHETSAGTFRWQMRECGHFLRLAYVAGATYPVVGDYVVRAAATMLEFESIQPEGLLEVLGHHY